MKFLQARSDRSSGASSRSLRLGRLFAAVAVASALSPPVLAQPAQTDPASRSGPAAATGTVAGTAFDHDGHRATDGEAILVDLRRRVDLAGDGTFRFADVPAGNYLLEVRSPTLGTGLARVEVAAGETLEIEISLDKSVLADELFVTASADPRSQLEVAQPTSVLAGAELDLKRQATLGETLADEPGVSSTYFGPGASRPVIRGLGGERVRVLTDGVGSGDAAGLSPDHAVSADPLAAERIEVIRGPATLLYGSSAVGGVVNVLDGRIPSYVPGQAMTGQVEVEGGSVSDSRAGAASLDGGLGRPGGGGFAWHVDYSRRETDDYEIPGFGPLDPEEREESEPGLLANSALETESGALGASWVGDRGYFGVAVSGFDTLYGIPGHGHEHEEGEEHEEDEEHEEGEEHEEDEEGVSIDLEQRRVDLRGEITDLSGTVGQGLFRGLKLRLGVADYEHVELEGAEVGTRFDNESWEARLELVQRRRGRLSGSIGLQGSSSDFVAIGEEAFVPPSVTDTLALFTFQEVELRDDLRLQLGARVESQEIDPESAANRPLEARSGEALSGSAGLVWDVGDRWSVGASAARTERQPNATELFALGPHAATRTFEIGDPGLDDETSLGLDLSLRKRRGRLTGVVNLFANRFDGYIFEAFTGEVEDDLDVVRFSQRDADFYGAELDAVARLAEIADGHLDLTFGVDLVRGELERAGPGESEDLPRIPPLTGRLGLEFHHGPYRAGVEVTRAEEQDRVATNETPTDGYTLLGATFSYRLFLGTTVTDVIVRGRNLTDEEARNHVSFLKDEAPLPGRDVSVALRVSF